MKRKRLYNQIIGELPEEERRIISGLLSDARSRIKLPRKYAEALQADFKNLIVYYIKDGLAAGEISGRLSPSSLSDFYNGGSERNWYPLDAAAKIYPLSVNYRWMSMFRISAVLKADIVPAVLQMALNFTIRRFPYFAVSVKKGFFWHYLDSTPRRFVVERERTVPCFKMNVSLADSPSFRVLYYKNRISVEFFHILADGTGGSVFLKTLTAEYLRLLGADIPSTDGVEDVAQSPLAGESENAFERTDPAKGSGFTGKTAIQLCGKRTFVRPHRTVQLVMSASALRNAAKESGGTVTSFMLAQMMLAAKKSAKPRTQGSFAIQVPVNMRKFYKTDTLRNFSMYCVVRLPIDEVGGITELVPEMARQLSASASKQELDKQAAAAKSLVRGLRLIPLFIKRPVALLLYRLLGETTITTTLSNLMLVKLPEEMRPFVESFDFVLGAPVHNKAACSLIAYGDTAVFSINKSTDCEAFEESLLDGLAAAGLDVALRCSGEQ